jgi:ankyrin repeat protein
MEPIRALDIREEGASASGILSQPKLAGHVRELSGSGHRYDNTTARDNARVQYGDQYHHYHYSGWTSEPAARGVEAKRLDELLSALAFPQMNFRFAAIADAYQSTCQWLFETPEYTRWRNRSLRQRHHGLLWLKGKPGSGKSTVTKCAVEYAQRTFADERTVYFFFNARGEPSERTVEGMFRSLLHQMVQDIPQLFGGLGSKDLATYSSQAWPSALLSKLFREAVCELSKHGQLACYIDALDEGDEDEVRELIDFLEELLEHAMKNDLSFSVYLASRHYPNISVNHSEALSLDDNEGHHEDISTYVHRKLRCRPASMQADLAAEIMQRSSGVFLWVVLVIRNLNKQSDRGNYHRLRSHLRAMPSGLNALFEQIVSEGDMSEYTLPALQIILFAYRALGPLELYSAILSIVHSTSEHPIVWDQDIVDEEIATDFIVSSSKGLLGVVTEIVFPFSKISRRSVQFIHESVREYLLGSGMKYLDPTQGDKLVGEANLRLARWCQVYLNFGLQRLVIPQLEAFGYCNGETLSSSFPFFSYAWKGILQHSESAACHGILLQDPYEMLLQSHISLFWDVGFGALLRLNFTPTVMQLLVCGRYTNLIMQQIKHCPHHELYTYVNAGCPRDYPNKYAEEGMNRTPLQIAISLEFFDLVELLLSHGADANASYREGNDHPLHLACASSQIADDVKRSEMIKILLRYGAEVDFVDDVRQTILHKEASLGGVKIVQMLLHNGANPNAKSGDQQTPLHKAVNSLNGVGIARSLIQHAVDFDARDIAGDTPLHKAVQLCDVEICKFLLECGADVNIHNRMDETPLHKGARNGNVEICTLLFQHGADVNARDSAGDTPLHKAVQLCDVEICKFLLECGADVNIHNRMDETPLHKGARDRNVEICKLLLEHGADVNARCELGHTLPHQAVRYSVPDDLYLFLQCNVIVDVCDDAAPLRGAIERAEVEVVKALLVDGAEVSSLFTGSEGRASFMDTIRKRSCQQSRLVVRLVTCFRNVPPAARFQARYALNMIIAEEGGREEL